MTHPPAQSPDLREQIARAIWDVYCIAPHCTGEPDRWAYVAAEQIAALSQTSAGGDWRPIDSAPRDGTLVLSWDGRSVNTAFWGRVNHPWNRLAWVGGHCRIDHIDQPTHWMPLPAAPNPEADHG